MIARAFATFVIAGLVPATPIMGHGRAMLSGVAGTSPAMTNEDDRESSARRKQGPLPRLGRRRGQVAQ
jgi:hypothetical protein